MLENLVHVPHLLVSLFWCPWCLNHLSFSLCYLLDSSSGEEEEEEEEGPIKKKVCLCFSLFLLHIVFFVVADSVLVFFVISSTATCDSWLAKPSQAARRFPFLSRFYLNFFELTILVFFQWLPPPQRKRPPQRHQSQRTCFLLQHILKNPCPSREISQSFFLRPPRRR